MTGISRAAAAAAFDGGVLHVMVAAALSQLEEGLQELQKGQSGTERVLANPGQQRSKRDHRSQWLRNE